MTHSRIFDIKPLFEVYQMLLPRLNSEWKENLDSVAKNTEIITAEIV